MHSLPLVQSFANPATTPPTLNRLEEGIAWLVGPYHRLGSWSEFVSWGRGKRHKYIKEAELDWLSVSLLRSYGAGSSPAAFNK